MISLTELWELRREGDTIWKPVNVPGCWEDTGISKIDPGPYWYRTTFQVPEAFSGRRIWLRFCAVSYYCRVQVNGHFVGKHIGAWDTFSFEITDCVQPGALAELLVMVEKPASLTAGPDSTHLPGHYPLRKTLSGFLPYVWGHAFGGIWQDVLLFSTGKRYIKDIWVHGTSDGQVIAEFNTSTSGLARIVIFDPENQPIWDRTITISRASKIQINLDQPKPWSTISPSLYNMKISLPGDDERTIRFGLRSFQSKGRILTLNNKPVFPRMILSWGWYANQLSPDPGPDRVQADMIHLRSLGYNGIKLCLWFPPKYYFDLADETGMLLWVELPLWLPIPHEGFNTMVTQEYNHLVIQARQHPSVVFYTLGCELGKFVNEELLNQLYTQTKVLTTGVLIRDNSGSGEAYGGSLIEHADFDDNHFYCDLEYLRPTLDAFSPGWRDEKPWLMGEFCDYDTFPDVSPRWWNNPDPNVNPQGARWEMRVTTHAERLSQNKLQAQVEELTTASYSQALVHRKYTLETLRARADFSGYVITGEIDTPVSTAGMWNSNGVNKFDPATFSIFNQDFVLILGWDRHRAWVSGGDRPSPRDRFNHVSGALVRYHLLGSNYSLHEGVAHVTWDIAFHGQSPFASGEDVTSFVLSPGHVRELTIFEFIAPKVDSPRQAVMKAQVRIDSQQFTNTWPVWFFPPNTWIDMPFFGLFDPLNILGDLTKLAGDRCILGVEGISVAVCSGWSDKIDTFVKRGGRIVMIEGLNGISGPLPVVPVPYWREALKLVENHSAWGDFPHGYNPDMQFYSMAPDCALNANDFVGTMYPIFRRLDMRGMELLEYAIELEWGNGRIIATTLRFSGGLGDQPNELRYCPAGQHLLANWIRSLHEKYS